MQNSIPANQRTPSSHVLVLGTGIAGLSAALRFAEIAKVTVVSKLDLAEGATRYAQGGIASVWSKTDSFEEHKKDTLIAGAGLCHEKMVDICVHEGPERVRDLIGLGVQFTKRDPAEIARSTADNGNAPSEAGEIEADAFDLHREGGHTKRRILHADDLTGWEIERALIAKVRAHSNIRVLENHVAVDLITEGKLFKAWRKPGRCVGAYVLDTTAKKILTLPADITILATGGAGRVYLYTSNPDTSTGDGVAIAYRAGARVANLEFMQFHPTCLYHPAAKTFLITEALRGEGAVLKTLDGVEFMDRYHALRSLAPRDVVARAIDMELKRTGDTHVLLDCSKISAEDLKKKFPNIYETCLTFGIDITAQAIPVVPAAHYTCGGVQVDENARTSIDHLYAVGEVACTGLHGANRLASNSLLEAVVFAHRAFEHAKPVIESGVGVAASFSSLPEWDTGRAVEAEEKIDIAATWIELRTLMWNYVGIVRSNRRLERAKKRLELLRTEIDQYYWNYILTKDLIELRNLMIVAELIVESALQRKESRGLHYTVDYPETDDLNFKRDTVV